MREYLHLSALTFAVAVTLLGSTSSLAAPQKEEFKNEVAVPCPTPPSLKSGFYLGGQVGYDAYRVRQSINLAGNDPDGDVLNPVIGANGWMGGLFLGYGAYFDDLYYLGGEVFGNASNAQQRFSLTDTDGTYYSKVEVNGSYGIALIPGTKLNNTSLGYVRLGYSWANIKINESLPASSISKSNMSHGFDFGVGIETVVLNGWSVRTEYNHTYYSSFNTSFGTSFSPSDNQFTVGLLYHFA